MKNRYLIGPFKEILTMEYMPLKGAIKDNEIPIIHNGGVIIEDGIIADIGDWNYLVSKAQGNKTEIRTLSGNLVAIPGMIDAHTHICWAGSRAKDYAMRVGGKSYLEIAASGGGIWDTVKKTRKASQDELKELVIKRANRLYKDGITTIEVKSGYALNVEGELKMLRAIKDANKEVKATLIPTCLAAHMKPKDFVGTADEYLKHIVTDLLPIVKSENLASRVDIFIEETAFTIEQANLYLAKAKEMGFEIVVHADQFSTGGSEVAVNFKAKTAEHLEASTDKEIDMLASSDVIAVALPGCSLGLGEAFTPARKILDKGGSVAIASDWNPGSAPMGDLLMQAAVLGAAEKLSCAEVLAGVGYRAAAALSLTDRGYIQKGMKADIIYFEAETFTEILWNQGKLKPQVIE